MKKELVLIALIALANIALSQGFNPISKNRTAMFKCDNNSHIMPIRVDSISVDGNDTTYHFYRTWDYQKATGYYGSDEDECVTPDGSSWIGTQAIHKEDGRFLFMNYEKDTLTLRPFADIDSTWVFYTFNNGDKLWATVESADNAEILGVNSLLKHISFMRKNSQGEIEPNYPTNLHVVISDSLGFVSLFPFRNLFGTDGYSDALWGNYDIPFDNYSLIGLTNPSVGRTLISNVSIYDFDIGDEFHYSSYSSSGWGSDDFFSENTKQISIVTNKTYSTNNDSIYYAWDNVKRHVEYEHNYLNPEITYSEFTSTTKVYIADTSFFFPEIAIIEEEYGAHYAQRTHSNNRMRIIPIEQPAIWPDEFPCWRIVWAVKHSDSGSHGYGEGIGYLGQYFESDYSQSSSALVYYKKGTETWGTPLVITSAPVSLTNSFSVYPNPVFEGGNVSIEPSNNKLYSVTLINSIGSVLYRWDNIQGNYQLPVPGNISDGLYFLILKGADGTSITKKLIVN